MNPDPLSPWLESLVQFLRTGDPYGASLLAEAIVGFAVTVGGVWLGLYLENRRLRDAEQKAREEREAQEREAFRGLLHALRDECIANRGLFQSIENAPEGQPLVPRIDARTAILNRALARELPPRLTPEIFFHVLGQVAFHLSEYTNRVAELRELRLQRDRDFLRRYAELRAGVHAAQRMIDEACLPLIDTMLASRTAPAVIDATSVDDLVHAINDERKRRDVENRRRADEAARALTSVRPREPNTFEGW